MLLSFVLASFLLSLSPGPDNVFVLLHSAVHGRKAGLLVVLGLCSGLLFHTAAVALGLAALLAASAMAFTVLKLIGAAYLLYLAWGAWNAPAGLGKAATTEALSPLKTYLRGVVMNVTNPKVAIFFLAFLPQFVDAERGDVPMQIALLGLLFGLTALFTFGVIAWFAARFGAVFQRSERAHIVLNRTAAVVFTGLAARLAFSSR
jgi:threonine/homoserine/homoserine lactone efflux protein